MRLKEDPKADPKADAKDAPSSAAPNTAAVQSHAPVYKEATSEGNIFNVRIFLTCF